ncbi:MAG: tRNA (adenosine(37)-N6)-threonylcarbamoyltransferase complex ATPase subunit type 1 TsaE [Alphaproteobacteria bacterium]|nr:tRNA (adenosine(37)-N6)-threonylcarbamoyltransferase complex ATPase subunit type 1 TsaE [Alphaproteobacteria bacterium]
MAPGTVIALCGELGAGKSEFARAFVRHFLPHATVPSPTFTLVQPYYADRATIWHFDLYRVKSPAELVELGIDEARRGIVLVEWPDRAPDLLETAHVLVSITVGPDGSRNITIRDNR